MLNLNIRSVLQEKTHGVSTNLRLLMGKKPNNHKLNVETPINEKFLPKILPIYQRLASNELLERCIRCGTQNANESLHSMIWAKCPKEIFVNKRRVKRAVTEAVCEYNKGTVRTIVETQKALGVATGGSTKQLATILDCRKQKFRKRRQNARGNSTSKRKIGKRPEFGLFHHLYPDLRKDERKFHNFFRISEELFSILLDLVGLEISKQDKL
ncbi:uncharacterized protein TNCV_2111461 [Trichonephila clavipes]|nr:uncharacterized protein TNCV_2111461 [Trichonephila clavipes]